MQTFLPYASFTKSAKSLDGRRLNKQCLEAMQLLKLAEKLDAGEAVISNNNYTKHPAFLMWRGFELSLWHYANAVFDEFARRHKGTQHAWHRLLFDLCYYQPTLDAPKPAWLGDNTVHSNHRARLLMKGELDVLVGRIKQAEKQGVEIVLNRRLKYVRSYTLESLIAVNKQLDEADIPRTPNFYKRFGWSEKMTDKNYWPCTHSC